MWGQSKGQQLDFELCPKCWKLWSIDWISSTTVTLLPTCGDPSTGKHTPGTGFSTEYVCAPSNLPDDIFMHRSEGGMLAKSAACPMMTMHVSQICYRQFKLLILLCTSEYCSYVAAFGDYHLNFWYCIIILRVHALSMQLQ